MNDEKTLTVLVVEPMTPPYVKEIKDDYRAIQQEVGGLFQAVYPYEDMVSILANDEGKLIGLPPNRPLKNENGETYDILCGTFLVVGLGEEDFKSLTKKQIETYTEKFGYEWLIPVPKEPKTNNKGVKNHER